MSKIDAYSFIKYYSRFYFDDPANPISEEEFETAGVPKNLKRTNRNLEKYIITKKLKERVFDAEAFAWKAGKAKWNENKKKLDPINPLPEKMANISGYIENENNTISMDEFNDYIKKHSIEINNYNLNLPKGRKELFLKIQNSYSLSNYGTVFIINQMFFLSKGAVPIYDQFAHIAVKALLMHVSPLEVFVPGAPSKNDPPKGEDNYYPATNILEEYMWLLNEVFPSEIHKDGEMYISRELDRALWVYGHATKKWPF